MLFCCYCQNFHSHFHSHCRIHYGYSPTTYPDSSNNYVYFSHNSNCHYHSHFSLSLQY
ncbi:hypothetical protein T492DRAFT_1112723 [Pavlovales sp. CCMP2436]|nr:hypothetical protein T492DRAFT_1112723 [Pavlovales sp. CCMP2436]